MPFKIQSCKNISATSQVLLELTSPEAFIVSKKKDRHSASLRYPAQFYIKSNSILFYLI
jgi:hypothetical protein